MEFFLFAIIIITSVEETAIHLTRSVNSSKLYNKVVGRTDESNGKKHDIVINYTYKLYYTYLLNFDDERIRYYLVVGN